MGSTYGFGAYGGPHDRSDPGRTDEEMEEDEGQETAQGSDPKSEEPAGIWTVILVVLFLVGAVAAFVYLFLR